MSTTTVRTAHRIVSKALNDAVRDGLMHRNPAAHIPLPKQVKPELQVWDRAQVAAFLAVAVSDRLHAAWLLALLCGLRRGELAGLRWRDVDLEGSVVRITSQRTTDAEWRVITKEPKGTSRRSIDLGPLLVAALTAHRHADEEERRQHGLTGGSSWSSFSPTARATTLTGCGSSSRRWRSEPACQ